MAYEKDPRIHEHSFGGSENDGFGFGNLSQVDNRPL